MNAITESTELLILPVETGDLAELLEREQRIERAQRNAYYEIGLELGAINNRSLYKLPRKEAVSGKYSFVTFDEYVESRFEMKRTRAYELIESANAVHKMSGIPDRLPARESHVRPLLGLKSDLDRSAVWRAVLEDHPDGRVTAPDVEAAVSRFEAQRSKNWITLTEWSALDSAAQTKALKTPAAGKQMNSQDNASIEWAQWSWNPITGCKHDCPYCYARDIADRFYPQKFEPSLLAERMHMPAQTQLPAKAAQDIAYKNVFTCSMADLFGRWVPSEWIESVLRVVQDNPQWNFLFLTKFPKRMAEFEFPTNAWLGTSVDLQIRVKAAEDAFSKISGGTKWLSIEPMIEKLTFNKLDMFDWVVMGGASRSTQTPEWVPPFDWVSDLYQQARKAGCKVYQKDNLGLSEGSRLREFPWQPDVKPARSPAVFAYLGKA